MANRTMVPQKFTTEAKMVFLETFAATGRKMHSARSADVCRMTVDAHLKDDPEFAEAFEDALEVYKESVRVEVRRRGIEGWLEPVFHQGQQGMTALLDENGDYVMEEAWHPVEAPLPAGAEMVGEAEDGRVRVRRPRMVPAFIRKYSDRMLELEAKRVDPAYRDKGQMDVNVRGGLLVVPGMASEEDFEREYSVERQLEDKGGE